MEDIMVLIMDLPYDVDGLSTLNEDGSYTIVLNARCSKNVQDDTYRHEMRHIKCGDHYKSDVQEVEYAVRLDQ